MTNCHKYLLFVIFYIESTHKLKGYEMLPIIKNAESLFEKFEVCVEEWAKKLF